MTPLAAAIVTSVAGSGTVAKAAEISREKLAGAPGIIAAGVKVPL
jgi:hypothetical protein